VVGFMAQPLYPKYQLNRRLGGPQRAGMGVLGRRKMLFPCRETNCDSFVILPTAQSLISLSYPHSLSCYPTHSTVLLAQPAAAQ